MKQFIVIKTGQWLRYHLVEGEDDPKGVYNPIVQQQLVHSSLNNPICTSNTYLRREQNVHKVGKEKNPNCTPAYYSACYK